ncbi:hypothetical protein EDD22DRAFT_851564 [Suillus occidentalis]|nr:hypothetical protein EDD22DRAFT_851564 [Suillus occidentalis]
MAEWYASWEGVLTLHKDQFVNGKNSCLNLLRQICDEIVAIHHTRQDSKDLPKGLKKAIQRYYFQFLTDDDDRCAEQDILGDELEEEPSGVSPKDRKLAAHPKEAGFYKKELNAWDITQKLFKQEMDDYDKEQQQKKGMQHSIKYRTGYMREWFNNMTSAHQKEVEETRDKWNREGAPAEAQTIYRKKSFKKVLDDFTKQMWHTMGCQIMILLNDHVSDPTNDDDSSDEDSKDGKDVIPDVILDEHGFAKLPSHKEVSLKGQQELVWKIFHASYKAFTGSKKLVPWMSIATNPLVYLDPDSIPNGKKDSKKKCVDINTDDEEEASAVTISKKHTRELAKAKASSQHKAHQEYKAADPEQL